MKFIFRVDSGKHIGNGHLSRCEALAEYFVDLGHQVLFCYRGHDHYRKPKFGSIEIGPGIHGSVPTDTKKWLGTDQEQDAKDFLAKIPNDKNMFLIVDHYSLGNNFESACRTKFEKIIVVDDLVNRKHDCDFLINYNPGFSSKSYAEVTPQSTKLLLGLDYFFVRKDFLKVKPKLDKIKPTIDKILVQMGTMDSQVLVHLVGGFMQSNLNKKLTVISDNETIKKLMSSEKISLQPYVEHIETYYLDTDYVIGAAGVSIWERAFFGIPSSVFMTAENQRDNVVQAQKLQIADVQNGFDLYSTQAWTQYFLSLGQLSFSKRESYRQKGLELVDGKGIERFYKNL